MRKRKRREEEQNTERKDKKTDVSLLLLCLNLFKTRNQEKTHSEDIFNCCFSAEKLKKKKDQKNFFFSFTADLRKYLGFKKRPLFISTQQETEEGSGLSAKLKSK